MGSSAFPRTAPYRARRLTLDEVAGVQEAKDEVQEIIRFLQAPEKLRRLGARVPHAVC